MRSLVAVIFVASVAMVMSQASQKYTDKYDAMNLDDFLGNKRLMTTYIKCVLEQGKCSPEGRELKSHITDALQTGCARCTGAQRGNMRRVIKHLIVEEKDMWKQLVEKYDPNRIYSQRYERELSSIF